MKRKKMTVRMALFALLAIPANLSAQQEEQQNKRLPHYTITDLGTLGGTFSSTFSINNRGHVSGYSTLPGDLTTHAFLWRQGLMIDLGTLGGPNSFAYFPLNDSDEVPGASEISAPDPNQEDFCGFGTNLICLPFVWQRGVMTPLSTLGGYNGGTYSMNNRGQVTGLAENTTPDPTCVASQVLPQVKPVIWEKGQIQELPTFPGDPDGQAISINDKGQAVGISGTCLASLHALLWQNGMAIDLGNLGGTDLEALDINNQGQVVGKSGLPGNTTAHAYLWQNGVMSDLGTLPGDFVSASHGINNKGQVVGVSCNADFSNCRAFLWQNGVMMDLNTLAPDSPIDLENADSINSRGEISGFGFVKATNGNALHAFLARPSKAQMPVESSTLAAQGKAQTLKPPLAENVRRMFRQRLSRRYAYGNFGLWAPEQ